MTRGCRDLRLSEHNLMGQHRHDISMIDRHFAKKSQSAFPPIKPKDLPIQGSGRAIPCLWDGSGLIKEKSHALIGDVPIINFTEEINTME